MPSSRSRVYAGAAVAVALVVQAGAAQTSPASDAAGLRVVDRFVRSELRRQRIPGMSVAVLRGDRVLLARGYGYASLEHRVPASDSTIYQSGSVGKQFTSAAILLLARQGKLQIDDPVGRYLPDTPASWSGITIRHLLTHTSGIRDYADSSFDYRRDLSEDALVHIAERLPVEFAPGTHWSYSNTGYVLLGAIIRRASGMFYGDFLRERVFEPLGMHTARVISEQDIVPNRSDGYRLVDGRVQHQAWVAPTLNTTADGALYLTVRDLARWAIGLNHGRPLARDDLRAAWTPVTLASGGSYPYGLGWEVGAQRGRPRIGHGGSWQGFRASIQRYPDADLTVIVLANLAEAQVEAISFAVAGLLEPSLRAPHVGPPVGTAPSRVRAAPRLLEALAHGDTAAGTTPALRDFLLPSAREALAELADPAVRWSPAGCEGVAGKGIERLGSPVAHLCYARGDDEESDHLLEVSYTADWQAAFVEWYDY